MISVIIPTKNNAESLDKCLSSLRKQNFRNFEIIVVDGHSKDNTKAVAKKYKAKFLYENFGTRGGACNVGAEHAKGDILVFTDDDCTFPRDWLTKINNEFKKDRELIVLGGNDIINRNATYFEEALYQLDLAKKLPKQIWKRLRGCNTAYRKEFFLEEKFNSKLRGIEETELHHRMMKKNFKMKFDPRIFVYHKRRKGFKALFLRFYTNGKSKIQLVKLNRALLSLSDIVAPLAIIFSLAVLVLSFFNSILLIWFLLAFFYFIFKSLFIVFMTKNFKYFPILPLIIFVREFAFGLGCLRGFS